MKDYFAIPLIFWFLFCTGAQAIIQVNFLLKFSRVLPKIFYYISFVVITYLVYIIYMYAPIEQNFITQISQLFIGVGIISIFSWRILKQNLVTSMIMGVLLITTNILIESLLTPLQSIAARIFLLSEMVSMIVTGILILMGTYALLNFFSTKYNIKSSNNSRYLLILVTPMLFLDLVMRLMMEIKYFPVGTNYNQLSEITLKQNYEFLGLASFAFICVCGMLLAYEKVTLSLESEQQKKLLLQELALQKKYVTEAKARYETTRIFRHDLKNHIIALGGMLKKNEIAKATKYLERFEAISEQVSFPVSTGNVLIDIILSDKLSPAKTAGIKIKYDITVPATVHIDDFDLAVIFSNAIDNAIRACIHVIHNEKIIDIVAKQNKNFFVLDIINTCEQGNIPSGTGLGLSSIKMIAEKYQGIVEIVAERTEFRLSVLLPFDKKTC